MTTSNYRHKLTKLIGRYDDKFAAVFGNKLEKVSDRVVASGTTVEENAAAINAEQDAATPNEQDSSKEGKK